MSSHELLEKLCAHYYISPEYHDIWGKPHSATAKTRQALLAAMGVEAETEEFMQQALNEVEIAQWCRLLPPVQVVSETEQRIEIVMGIAEEQLQQRLRWSVLEESGLRHNGEFLPTDLALREAKMLAGETRQHRLLVLPGGIQSGYHRLELHNIKVPERPLASMSLIVAPERCYQPQVLEEDQRIWGPAIQLYALRSTRNWGIGDFTDLIRVLEFAARAGAALVGVNPLHALFPHNPAHASPYSPSSRLFLNTLYLDVEAVPDFDECQDARQRVEDESFQVRLRALRHTELVDYVEVANIKTEILSALYQHFRRRHLNNGSDRATAFRRFQEEQGVALHQHALYEALQREFYKHDPACWGWPVWPKAYRSPQSEAVVEFAVEHAEQVQFFEYLQWQASMQLQSVGRRAYQLGLGVGLYQDLAVSVDVGGAEAWNNQGLYALSARIGSPPDDFNLKGQDWGLPPWRPKTLREQAYAPFIVTLRQNMHNAGALRIDHVMALMRLFWVPPGEIPEDGSYVHYPFEDLLGILALESQRNQCLVIGEDLGTVPDEVRQALHPRGVLSYRLLYFEKTDANDFKPPSAFPSQALVAVTTHDLPTLAGYWQGRDIELRQEFDLFPSAELRAQQVINRARDRVQLLMALEREDLLPEGVNVQAVATPTMTPVLVESIHRYLSRSPARVMMVQMEDILGQLEQVNFPGTTEQYPNWSRKLTLNLELWDEDPRVVNAVAGLREERGSTVRPPTLRILPGEADIPRSTYRLQLHRDFGFDQVTELIPYLALLGISHCYASPCLQARPGSPHGYDIINHGALNTELGGDAGFNRLSAALHANKMGLLLDMVPNHMGVMGNDNAWWLDVLENGPASNYAAFFDIDWNPLKSALRGKVLLPVLGGHYGSLLETAELALKFDEERGAFSIHYYEHEFPIDPGEYPRILGHDINRLEERLGSDDTRLQVFQTLITAFEHLPSRSKTGSADIIERARDKEVHKAGLARLYRDVDISHFINENITAFNSDSGIEVLHELLEHQAWRLAYWRVASDEINYRRFFDINELAGLRMEDAQVFEATHKRTLELIAENKVQGLRIDHPDGLYNPVDYFRRLQARVAMPEALTLSEQGELQPVSELPGPAEKPFYLLVEKILAGHERLRSDWAVHGTTGYEFINLVNGLFVDGKAEEKFDRLYREFIGNDSKPDEILYRSKKLIMRSALASELNVLAQHLSRIAELDRHTRDFTLNSLREALNEVVACFPVYRTYVSAESTTEEDRRYVDWAVKVAKKRSHAADASVFDFIREVLLIEITEGKHDEYRRQVIVFTMKFQQYTGPVMAKGMEDTAFYRYNRLVSLNEVGGEPERFGVSVAALHHQLLERSQNWPHAMLSSSTHDSKRSEDVRARINLLSELPAEWRSQVRRWARLNRSKKRLLDGRQAPSSNDEYLLYQTLLGTWPLESMDAVEMAYFRDRIKDYMLKAVKEAKVFTSWVNSDPDYENAITDFVEAVLNESDKNPFLAEFIAFQRPLSHLGLYNSLAQTLLKLTAPGVPDIYQGNELWDFSLVDPDNRRPVDYARREALLAQLRDTLEAKPSPLQLADELMQNLSDGRAKLYLIWRCLQLRREQPALFADGDYQPLTVTGIHADHVCAFARSHGGQRAVIVVPRLLYQLTADADLLDAGMWDEEIWGDTVIQMPEPNWHNHFTGQSLQAVIEIVTGNGDKNAAENKDAETDSWSLPVSRVLSHFPVALLRGGEKA
ncbi:MAG: malto-oligosyltrehalose synthase [Gammaproteobacteria bacterium]|nr:malto-oligosyltrehalose synthase [Gammaproteobacteria bacterium]